MKSQLNGSNEESRHDQHDDEIAPIAKGAAYYSWCEDNFERPSVLGRPDVLSPSDSSAKVSETFMDDYTRHFAWQPYIWYLISLVATIHWIPRIQHDSLLSRHNFVMSSKNSVRSVWPSDCFHNINCYKSRTSLAISRNIMLLMDPTVNHISDSPSPRGDPSKLGGSDTRYAQLDLQTLETCQSSLLLTRLPAEVLLKVFSHLPAVSLPALYRTCQQLRHLKPEYIRLLRQNWTISRPTSWDTSWQICTECLRMRPTADFPWHAPCHTSEICLRHLEFWLCRNNCCELEHFAIKLNREELQMRLLNRWTALKVKQKR